MIENDTIQKVKDASNIADVVAEFIPLKKDGVDFTCLCPFHQDRHLGSFKVSARRNIYKCFSCGEMGGPVDFLMKHQGLSFVDAIRWLGSMYSIPVDGADKYKVRKCKKHTPPPPLPTLELPKEFITKKANLKDNTFYKWLLSLPFNEDQRRRVPRMINSYKVGAAKEGHTIFWQQDEEGILRTGKMMLYKSDGHRDKEAKHNFDYIHSMLEKIGYWNPDKYEYKTTYYGMHLIDMCPQATINIVESEKTALICAILYGDMQHQLWIASGGLNFLNREKMKPLIERGRYILLHPDRDGIEQWKQVARDINYDRLAVSDNIVKDFWIPEDGPKADIADILLRRMSKANKVKPNDNEGMKILMDKLNLDYDD